jgi:hypothetical protein
MANYKVSAFLTELADREAIRHCLMRYSRGVDRLDEELLQSVYWPGAIDDHIIFTGTGQDFIPYVIQALGGMDQTMHMLGNILIDMDGPAAANSETYFQAFHRIPGSGSGSGSGSGVATDLIVGGRYVDRFEKRDDEWRVASRVVIIDWFREYPDSGDFGAKPLGLDIKPGLRKPNDRSYELMRKINK